MPPADSVNVAVVAVPGLPGVLVRRTLAWAADLGDVSVGEVPDLSPGGPLVLVWADVPMLGGAHARSVRDDHAAGADLLIGPTLDGGVYLVYMREPVEGIVGVPFPDALARAAELGWEGGMMRHERALRRKEDRIALLADPLLPGDVRAAIS